MILTTLSSPLFLGKKNTLTRDIKSVIIRSVWWQSGYARACKACISGFESLPDLQIPPQGTQAMPSLRGYYGPCRTGYIKIWLIPSHRLKGTLKDGPGGASVFSLCGHSVSGSTLPCQGRRSGSNPGVRSKFRERFRWGFLRNHTSGLIIPKTGFTIRGMRPQ
jgi:hypothetical protein